MRLVDASRIPRIPGRHSECGIQASSELTETNRGAHPFAHFAKGWVSRSLTLRGVRGKIIASIYP